MFACCFEAASPNGPSGLIGNALCRQVHEGGLAEIPFDDSEIHTEYLGSATVTLAQQRQWNTVESKKERGIVRDSSSGACILSWSRIDNRDELKSKLAEAAVSSLDAGLMASDAGLILAAWKKWGESVCTHLLGDFAFVIYQPGKTGFFVGRDHLGVRPLYYYQDKSRFVVATSLAVISGCENLDLSYSKEWLSRYILECSADWDMTPYRNIHKLPPAHSLSYQQGQIDIEPYFTFSPDTGLALEPGGYVEQYLACLSRAVSDRVCSDYPIAAELSGGLDSSSLVALASRLRGESLQIYSIARSKDEPACIQALEEKAGIEPAHIFSSEDLRESDFSALEQRFFRILGTPVEQGIANAHHLFYQAAQKKGARTLLSGFGGDEFTTNYGSMALTDLWRSGQYASWLGRFKGNTLGSKLRALRWLIRYALGMGSIASAQLRKRAQNISRLSPLSKKLFAEYPLEKRLYESGHYDFGYKSINDFILGNRWTPAVTARLENCTLMAASYGLEYRWPLLDIRLLQLFLSVPADQKLGPGGIGRYLHRRAMAGVLPDELIWRGKDMGPPIPNAINEQTEKAMYEGCNRRHLPNHSVLKGLLDDSTYADLLSTASNQNGDNSIERNMLNRIDHLERWLCRQDNTDV